MRTPLPALSTTEAAFKGCQTQGSSSFFANIKQRLISGLLLGLADLPGPKRLGPLNLRSPMHAALTTFDLFILKLFEQKSC
jgi:hypothetical protein